MWKRYRNKTRGSRLFGTLCSNTEYWRRRKKFYLCSQKVQRTTEDERCASQPAGTVDHHDPSAADPPAVAAVLLTSHRARWRRHSSRCSRGRHQAIEGTAYGLVDSREQRPDGLGERRTGRHVRHPHCFHSVHAAGTSNVGVFDGRRAWGRQGEVVGDCLSSWWRLDWWRWKSISGW